MKPLLRLFALLALVLGSLPAYAVQPDEVLDDPTLETRARAISADLRCLVCQNQSIDDSDAELARDLRLLVRERLVAGDSDTEVVNYIVDRYGEFVLLRPVMGLHTFILWVAAPVLLLIGLVVLFLSVRKRRINAANNADMTPEEKKALERLMSE